MIRVRVIDSHTGGEPTRVVIGQELAGATMIDRRNTLIHDLDSMRSGLVCEPRGSDIMVGAWMTPPVNEGSHSGIVFFNNVGALGMCGHGLIGVVATLYHLDQIGKGESRFDTPVGTVTIWLNSDRTVTFENITSYRYLREISVDVPGYGTYIGDVAYGGNWFFLASRKRDICEENRLDLLAETLAIKEALTKAGITGKDGAEIDHVELFGPAHSPANNSRNFVLCPGNAYDRSPCGTGTSAKLACLAADGRLAPGEPWRQESITGSVFEGTYQEVAGGVIPRLTGRAHVVAESELIFAPDDPLTGGRLG